MTDITPIVAIIIALIFAIITIIIAPWIKSRTTSEQLTQIMSWVNIAVLAAEQLFKGVGRGEEKKQYVIDFLKSKGYYIDAEKIEAMIEAEVAKLNGGKINEA
jgi:H+/gluconate symporter-like permease